MDYHFEVIEKNRYLISGPYREEPTIILLGRVLSPDLKTVSKAFIHLNGVQYEDPESPSSEKIKAGIGHMQILRDKITLFMYCNVPARSLSFIAASAGCGKIKRVSIYGDKLRYGSGAVSYVSLRTRPEEDS